MSTEENINPEREETVSGTVSKDRVMTIIMAVISIMYLNRSSLSFPS